MALTTELLKGNAATAGLSDEQINAVVEMSKNDETAVIGQKTGEIYGGLDADILAASGIAKNGAEKTYDYAKRVIGEIKGQAGDAQQLQSQIAILMEKMGVNVWLAMLIVLLMGLAIGFYQGTLVTKMGIPAFITTLAGMFIFRGLLSRSLAKTGTIIVTDPTFKAMCQGFIPDIPGNHTGVHIVTMIIAVIAVAALIWSQVRSRKNKEKYGFPVTSMWIFITGMVIVSVVILLAAWMLAIYKGIPISACIVGVILAAYAFMLSKTKLGRHIYGIGGNDQAAELSGVDVKKVTLFAFCSMAVLAAVSGFLYTSRLSSATPTAGLAFEMDAIASSYIGGTAVSGGVGKVTNAIIGTFVIMSLTNGMNLLTIDISYQYIVKGIIFIIAVAFDVRSRKK